MDNSIIESFIRKQTVAFICSVDEEGFPNVKAMLKPRKMEGIHIQCGAVNLTNVHLTGR